MTTGLQRVKDLLVPTVSADNCDVSNSNVSDSGEERRVGLGRSVCEWDG